MTCSKAFINIKTYTLLCMVDEADEIERILNNAENLDVDIPAERFLQEEDKHVVAQNNLYQGVVNSSMGQITTDEGGIFVYSHSPDFTEGQKGYGRVRGVGDTGYLPLKVQSAAALPDPRYEGSGYVEIAVEHDDIQVEEDQLGSLQVVPYDPEQLGSESWRDVLESYNSEDGNIQHRNFT